MTRSPAIFILSGWARSGSTLLSMAIGEDPRIAMFYEIFHENVGERGELAGRKYKDGEDGYEFLRTSMSEAVADCEAFGFKWFYHHARTNGPMGSAWRYFREHNEIRVIFLQRPWFEMLVSYECALRSGNWIVRRGEPRALVRPFALSAETCERFFRWQAKWRSVFLAEAAQHPILRLQYRDLVDSFRATMITVYEFLGVTPVPCRVLTRRQRLLPIQEQVKNYGELRTYFRRTPFEECFAPGFKSVF